MANWIASDKTTAAALIRRFGCTSVRVEPDSDQADSLRALLQSQGGIAVLGGESPEFAVVATIRCSLPHAKDSPPALGDNRNEPRQIATGFLGLVDELVWDEEEAPKRAWWQKLLD